MQVGRDYVPQPDDGPTKREDSGRKAFKSAGTLHSKYTRSINPYEAPPIPPPAPVLDVS